MAKKAFSKKNLWDQAPRSIKSIVGLAARFIPPSLLLGSRFRAHCAFLARAERWSADERRAYQLNQLRRVLALAYGKSPFYRESFEAVRFDPRDFHGLGDLSTLPLIDKHTVLEHGEEMCVRPPTTPDVDYVSTGGSQGQPMHFYIGSNRSAIEYAHLITSWLRVGYKLGDPMAVFRGRIIKVSAGEMPHEYDPLLRHHYYSTFDMNAENTARYLDHLRRWGPCFMHVYPSSVAQLAQYVRQTNTPAPQISGVIAESENVYPDQRRLVEEVFGCRYFSCYGHSEKLVCAAECEHSSNYHVWPTYGYCELIDERGNIVTTPGKRGEIVGTGFINDVMPFVRYRTGDFATFVADSCDACGRQQMILADIRGHRMQEMLVLKDGSLVSWTAVNLHDATFEKVRQVQFYQDSPGRAVLRVVPSQALSGDDKTKIVNGLQRRLQNKLEFSLEVCDSIPLTGRGKFIYVDQRLNVELVSQRSTSDEPETVLAS